MKIYWLENKLGIISRIEYDYIILDETNKTYWDLLLFSELIFNETLNLSKEEFIKTQYRLLDFKIKPTVQRNENYNIFRVEINFINNILEEDFNTIKNFILEIFNKIKISKDKFTSTVLDYQKYFQSMKDNPTNYAKIKFNDYLYKDETKRLKFEQILEYFDNVKIENMLNIQEKIENLEDNYKLLFIETTKQKEIKNILNSLNNVSDNFQISKLSENITNYRTFNGFQEIKNIDNSKENQAVIQMVFKIKDETKIEFKNNYFNLLVLNEIFGGSAVSRLFTNIREKENLCYTIYSQYLKNIGFKVFTEVDIKNIEYAKEKIINEWQNLKSISENEFKIAKNKLKNDYLKNQNNYYLKRKIIIDYLENTKNPQNISEVIEKIEAVEINNIKNLIEKFDFQLFYVQN